MRQAPAGAETAVAPVAAVVHASDQQRIAQFGDIDIHVADAGLADFETPVQQRHTRGWCSGRSKRSYQSIDRGRRTHVPQTRILQSFSESPKLRTTYTVFTVQSQSSTSDDGIPGTTGRVSDFENTILENLNQFYRQPHLGVYPEYRSQF